MSHPRRYGAGWPMRSLSAGHIACAWSSSSLRGTVRSLTPRCGQVGAVKKEVQLGMRDMQKGQDELAEEVKRLSLSNIHGEFCTVAREDRILELLGVGAEGARAEGVMGGEGGEGGREGLGGGQQGVAEAHEGAGVGGQGAPLEAAKTAE